MEARPINGPQQLSNQYPGVAPPSAAKSNTLPEGFQQSMAMQAGNAAKNGPQTISAGADVETVKQATQSIEAFIKSVANGLVFDIDEDTGKNVVRLVDLETKEVIRQIPSQEVLEIAKTLDKLQGLLVSGKA